MPILDRNSSLISRDFDDVASLPYVHAFRYSLPTDPESAMIFKTIHSTKPCSLSSFYQPHCCPCLILSSAIIIAITAVPNLNASRVFYRDAYREGAKRSSFLYPVSS